MTDRIFLRLSEKWALGYDRNQWIVMVYRGSRWRSISFIGSHKGVLMRVLAEKGAVITPEAQAALDTLPVRFLDWLEEHRQREVEDAPAGRAPT